jgi:hypothetical protein
MKVRHKTHGTVVEVPEELASWSPDRSAGRKRPGKPQSTPWFQWAQWEQVDDSTPVTTTAKAEPDDKAAAAKSSK